MRNQDMLEALGKAARDVAAAQDAAAQGDWEMVNQLTLSARMYLHPVSQETAGRARTARMRKGAR